MVAQLRMSWLIVALLLLNMTLLIQCRASSMENGGIRDGHKRRRLLNKEKKKHSCCDCGVGVYRGKFISRWNKTTHPYDYPDKLAHFSQVIGGTHRGEHVLWQLGSKASSAVKKFSEWGDIRSLLNETSSKYYLGRIKSSAVWHSHKPVSMKFRADKSRHFLSLLSKITPSPDWFVGIDRLDLCNKTTCHWRDNITLLLTPIDAGTDSGLKFRDTNSQTYPAQPIRRLTPSYPNHPEASFYNHEQKSIAPMAEFRIQLVHAKGRCPDSATYSGGKVNCKVSRWSSWAPCSTPCGRGKKKRGRVILVHPTKNGKACPRISRVRSCRGRNCTGHPLRTDCQVKSWSKWTRCSQTCGRARRVRKREISVTPRGGGKDCPKLSQKKRCNVPACPSINCVVSEWSTWSECSKSCGEGKRRRIRRVEQEVSGSGKKCPKLKDRQACNVLNCAGRSRLSSISG